VGNHVGINVELILRVDVGIDMVIRRTVDGVSLWEYGCVDMTLG